MDDASFISVGVCIIDGHGVWGLQLMEKARAAAKQMPTAEQLAQLSQQVLMVSEWTIQTVGLQDPRHAGGSIAPTRFHAVTFFARQHLKRALASCRSADFLELELSI